MSLAVVLHDVGDPAGGAGWRAAAPGPEWEAPDLPGHGDVPAPRHGAYDPSGPWTLARWRIAHHGLADSLVVGVGENALGALILAAGGACEAAVVVDGLWGPWPATPEERVEVMYRHIRAVLADEPSWERPPAASRDPRTSHGYALVSTARQCRRFWGAVECPVLVVETPASCTPSAEREERVSWFGGPTTLVDVPDTSPATILRVSADWWGR